MTAKKKWGFLQPTPTPYDPLEWVQMPLEERGRLGCQAWALDGYGTPPAVFLVYLAKIALYVFGWAACCTTSPALGPLSEIGTWWLHPLAFQKAILFSMLFEGLGLGCGSGPLTGRYMPPIGGLLYWLRPGTTKLPLFRSAPLIGGHRRTWFDVAVYAVFVGVCGWALVSPEIAPVQLLVVVVVVPLLGVLDKTLFLAARAEHYWVTALVFLWASSGDAVDSVTLVAGSKAVMLALWFFAGFSKLNHHFPSTVCVMTSNSPLTRGTPLRRWVYRSYPDDLRPSRFAVVLAHAGTLLELSIPLVLVFATDGPWLTVGIGLALLLHCHITSSVPMAAPLEWNVLMVYGLFALFVAHPEIQVFDLGLSGLSVFLLVALLAIPLLGNLFPNRVSFLLAMRYYAGNWPYGIWLFRGESYRKLDRLTKSAAWVHDQLARFYDHATAVGLVGKVLAFRLMHLQGRCLPNLIPKAVDRLQDFEYVDGEIIAGLALGWNFGDGHLHNETLLAAIQAQCQFEPGELRCIFVEAQPLFGKTLEYRIVDAATGRIEKGTCDVAELRTRQPWQCTPAETADPRTVS